MARYSFAGSYFKFVFVSGESMQLKRRDKTIQITKHSDELKKNCRSKWKFIVGVIVRKNTFSDCSKEYKHNVHGLKTKDEAISWPH